MYGFHGLVVTGYVGVQGILQTADELIVFNVLLFDERLDTFMEVSLVHIIMAIVPVHVVKVMADRPVSLFWKRIVVVMWAGRCTRIRWVDLDGPLSRNGLRGDHGVRRAMSWFLSRRGRFSPRSGIERG